MPHDDPDPTDPNMLVGVMLPADAEATRDMAYVFAEEFARLGYTREQLLALFKNPCYGGAHGAYLALGEKETLSIIDECLTVWGNFQVAVQDVQADQTPSLLTRDTGKERYGTNPGPNGTINLQDDLNGMQRLNDLNRLNPRREEQDDG